MASSSDDEPNLADFLNRHKPEGSQDSDLPAWIQSHVSSVRGWGFDDRTPALPPVHNSNCCCLAHSKSKCILVCLFVALQTPVKVPIDISDGSDDEATAPAAGAEWQSAHAWTAQLQDGHVHRQFSLLMEPCLCSYSTSRAQHLGCGQTVSTCIICTAAGWCS
jgi:hypothetical protein